MRFGIVTVLLALMMPATTFAGNDEGGDWRIYRRNLEHTFSNATVSIP
jgi:hypothetical protein